jgi:hypothetical protein
MYWQPELSCWRQLMPRSSVSIPSPLGKGEHGTHPSVRTTNADCRIDGIEYLRASRVRRLGHRDAMESRGERGYASHSRERAIQRWLSRTGPEKLPRLDGRVIKVLRELSYSRNRWQARKGSDAEHRSATSPCGNEINDSSPKI